ncbi:hypothetical protein LEP1GSC060_0863 [Leptospira weilii serovar Ranarum str. ICFT]|uniref:Uncharacterized protein n=1 Tax=Leptospira weilii serovar Ranarum str. ICFT TaxID=1218598 RepID=N1WP44_9LEPT|nr:hypothetical protein [Leptospira weilii]EMY78904.1 hypothetical protein LEP1GSC060_0863 [Leptospira weilii serovar Ranarum str. ICFT]
MFFCWIEKYDAEKLAIIAEPIPNDLTTLKSNQLRFYVVAVFAAAGKTTEAKAHLASILISADPDKKFRT